MIYKMFSIFDVVDGTFDQQVFLQRSEKRALDNFYSSMESHNKQCEETKRGTAVDINEYRLYIVGEFDTETGVITPCTPRIANSLENK